MRCDHRQNCPWVGRLNELEEHLGRDCEHAVISCSKECRDGNGRVTSFPRKELHSHQRECPQRAYDCQYCGTVMVFATKESHFQTCGQYQAQCPSEGCSSTVQRRSMKKHLATCQHVEVSCKYMRLGCDTRMKRKEIHNHEESDDKIHLHKALDVVSTREQEAGTIRSGESKTFKVTQFEKKKRNNEMVPSPSYYTQNGCHMTITVFPNGHEGGKGSHVSVTINTGESNRAFKGTVTITLLNQLADQHHHTCSGKSFYETFASHDMLGHDQARNIQYLKDDTLYFKVAVDIPNPRPWLESKR